MTAQAPTAITGWRARLAGWWSGEKQAPRTGRLTQRQHRAPMPAAALSAADRERIMQIEAPQYVWGKARCRPGTPAFYERLMAPLSPSADKTLLVVGAGLGGPACVLHEKFGAAVTGLEPSPAVAGKAAELIEAAELADRVDVRPFNPELPKLPGRSFDCALVEPLLFAVHNKVELLRELDLTLKGNGQMVLLDFVMGSLDKDDQADWRDWLNHEKPRPRVRTMGEQKELFRKAKLKLRGSNDITAIYNAMIVKAWARCLDRLEDRPRAEQVNDPVLRGVVELAEFWARRAALLEAGVLKVARFHLAKARFGR